MPPKSLMPLAIGRQDQEETTIDGEPAHTEACLNETEANADAEQQVLERFFKTADELIEENQYIMQRSFSSKKRHYVSSKSSWSHTEDALSYAKVNLHPPLASAATQKAAIDSSGSFLDNIQIVKSRLRPVAQSLTLVKSGAEQPSSSSTSPHAASASDYLERAISRLRKAASTTATADSTASSTTSSTAVTNNAFLMEARTALRPIYASLF
jgi:hypothetical protein